MNLTICNLDSSIFVNSTNVPWAVQAIDSFCKEITDGYLNEVALTAAPALAYYARNVYDDSGNTTEYVFDKECLRPERRVLIPNTGNINTFSSWCRHTGLLYDQRGLFGLSEIASLLLKPKKISVKEFAFMLLAKQWVKIERACYRPLLSVIDTLTQIDDTFITQLGDYTQNREDVKDSLSRLFFNTVTEREMTHNDRVSFVRFDTLRYCLVQAGLLTEKSQGFKLTDDGKRILADFHRHESRISSYGKSVDAFYHYMCSISNGAFSLISNDNVDIYQSIYPNLSKLALQHESTDYCCIPAGIPVTPLQQIYFGAPGTGKSFQLAIDTGPYEKTRVIFHPDMDYSAFVGSYKPVPDNGRITYTFRAQAFINAYVNAWLSKKPYFLIIEEINRGNCAQIFGDIFQLLDRKDGVSSYTIQPDTDLAKYLNETFHNDDSKRIIEENGLSIPEDILSGEAMRLPENLILRATMNTSDQSLFPMDSAFKRRWDWKYFSIKDEEKGFKISLDSGERYDWWQTIDTLNTKIYNVTKSADKQLGYWFAKIPDGETIISPDIFVSKVIFYLWNDIFKDYTLDSKSAFSPEIHFESFYNSDGSIKPETIVSFMKWNGIRNESEVAPETAHSSQSEDTAQ